ncbi:MAG: tetratricopeptide repeat protein [Crocinitomicaceae bacterium]|nr:tetratricopeptide repeat protein [Crocinitomicaceae bacterium]
MSRFFLTIAFLSHLLVFGQTSDKYNSEYAEFYRAEDLFEKEQYGAARMEFRSFMNSFDRPNDPMYVKAAYYEAISALELYNNDAIRLLEEFNRNYPESIHKKGIYFRLGKYYYYKRKYEDALVWFNKLSAHDVDADDREEFYFKIGYANFKEKQLDAARDAFYEVKDGVTQYASPALYYYSHIAYQHEKYQMALDGFLKLEQDPKFGKVVPYYIAQIYYLQEKYELVTEYASKVSSDSKLTNKKSMDHLIGDAFYRIGKYDESVPYLERYNKAKETTREDDYRLGYAYYKSGHCDKAIRMFDRVKKEKDSLAQVAYYHIGECLIKADNKVSARSAFEAAAFIDKDPVIQEDALYNYAVLSYEMDINPYDEAVEAFEMYLARYPNSERKEDVYQYLVNVYTNTNNYAKALTSLDKLPNKDVRLKTAYQLIAFNQGVSRFQKANYPGAIESFKLVDLYPIDPMLSGKAVYWKADANYRLHKYDKAILGYKKFIGLPSTLSPQLKHEARYNIGYCHLKTADVISKKIAAETNEDRKKALIAQRDIPLSKSSEAFRSFVKDRPDGGQKTADAYMRIGDAYFVQKKNNLAIDYYKKALVLKSGYEDQALFYIATTYGYTPGGANNKITHLLDIINNYKSSKYLQQSVYNVADSYKSQTKYTKAKQYFNQIIFDYPSSNLVVTSRINVADINWKEGNIAQAEMEYLDILEQYGKDNNVCKTAAGQLKDLYLSQNEQEKIEQLANDYACIELNATEQENLYYLPAIEAYNDSIKPSEEKYQDAIAKFNKYLNKFPEGRYEFDVKNYLADCHFELGEVETAISLYRETLEGPNTGFTEEAALRVSKHLFNNGFYEESIPYYGRLEQTSSNPEIIFNAKLGLMRANYLIENWTNASNYADQVLKNSQINNELELTAYYVKGMSNYNINKYGEAKSALEWVVNNTTTERASEAKFSIAEMHYKQQQFDHAESEVNKLLKMKPSFNYWVAKGMILKSRVYVAQDKLFDAESNLKSVIDHYPVSDDGILNEADALWSELMQLKDQPKNLEEEEETTIEINGEAN